jgi:MFS family permease
MMLLQKGDKKIVPVKARLAVGIFFFLSGFTFTSWASRIPTFQQKFGLNDAQLGNVLFVLPLGLIVTLPITGMLLSKIHSRYLMLVGALAYALLLPVLGIANALWQLVIILLIFGSSRNFLNVSVNAQSVAVQSLYSKSIIASFHGIWSLAGFAGAAVGSFMITQNISPFIHFAMVGSLCLLLIVFGYKNTLVEDLSTVTKRTVFALPDKSLVKLGLIAFCSMSCEGTMYDWSSIYFQKIVHVPPTQIGWAFTAFMSPLTTGRFLGDRMISKHGAKKILQVSGILMTTGLLLIIILPYIVPVLIGFIIAGLGASCVIPLIMGLAGKTTTMSSGAAIASVSIVSYAGFLLGPPIIGYVSHAFNLRWSFSLIALSGALITFLVNKISFANTSTFEELPIDAIDL